MPNLLTDLQVDFVSLVDRAAVRDPVNKDQPMRFLVWKRDTTSQEDTMTLTPEETAAALTKAQEDLTKANERADAAEAKVAKQDEQIEALTKSVDEIKKAAGITDEPAKVDKSELSPAMRAHVEKMEADAAALADRVAKAEKDAEADREIAKAERETRLTNTYIAKAEEFKALPINPAEFGPVLKSVHGKLTEGEAAALDRVLKAADAAMVTAGLFKEAGRSGDGPNDGDTVIAKVTKAAAEIRKADPKLGHGEAMQQVLAADRELASAYLDEVRAA